MKVKALFLDRDGVVNVDHGYTCRIEDFLFTEGLFPFLRAMQAKGYLPVIVTNQSGIGRGYYTEEDFEVLTAWMLTKMREAGIKIGRDQVFHCPHRPDAGCDCRKPKPGMLLAAQSRFGIDMADSWMVGDKPSDLEAAQRAGVGHTVQVRKDTPDFHEILEKVGSPLRG